MSPSNPRVPGPPLQRSELAVPASSPNLFEKALASDADVVLLDLEDAVAPADKSRARSQAIEALNDLDWHGAGKTVAVRINALDTGWCYPDLVEVLEGAGGRLDTVMLPKAGAPGDIHLIDILITRTTAAAGFRNPIGIEALIETAQGLAGVEAIAAAGGRLAALHFGAGDLAASLQARTVNIGGLHPDYPGDPWHAALSRVAAACRACGLRPVDGPYGDFDDRDGYLAAARRAAALGFEGKWAIHPSQIAPANEVFSPTDEEVRRAGRILEALEQAEAGGRGAARLDGRMIDAASARMAANVMAMHERIRRRTGR